MKLKTVQAKFEYVIAVADDDTFPLFTAREYLIDALRDMGDGGADIKIRDCESGDCKKWLDDCIPYGGDGNTTTGQWLAQHNAKKGADDRND